MTLRGFSASYRYQIKKLIKVIPAAIILTFAAFMLIAGFMNYTAAGSFTFKDCVMPGADIYSAVEMFVMAAIFSFDFYNTSAANGVSRRTTLAASAAAYGTVSAVGVLIISVMYPVLAAATESTELWLAELMYGSRGFMRLYGETALVFRLRMFTLAFFVTFLAALAGTAAGSVFYRVPRKIGAALCMAGIFLPNIISAAATAYCNKHGLDYSEQLDKFFMPAAKLMGFARANGKMAGNVGKGIFMMILFSAVCALIAWLAARRAAVKPAAVRND